MRLRRIGLALTAASVLTMGLVACGSDSGSGGGDGSVIDKIKNGDKIVVGTKWDQPSLGLKSGGGDPQGFDVDVA